MNLFSKNGRLSKHREHLEGTVEERTAALKERVKELEIFHDAAVDRELVMEELRKKIAEFEKRLKGKG